MAFGLRDRRGPRRVAVAFALVAVIVGGCQSAVSPNPTVAEPSRRSFGSGPSGRPGGSPTAAPFDVTDSHYRPDAGRAGGSITIGDVTKANAFQPFFATQPTDRNVAAAVWAGLVNVAPDGRYLPDLAATVPTTTNGGAIVPGANDDAMTVTWR